MKEFKGTPGPWEVHMPGGTCVIDKNDKVVTCLVSNCETDPAADVADAMLVAAAPDLLEALQQVVAISDRKHRAWDKAHAAIAKALGEDHE